MSIRYHGKADVLAIIPDARASMAKAGWVITSETHGDLNVSSFASVRDAWTDAYDTIRMAPNGSSIRNAALSRRAREAWGGEDG